MNYLKNKVTYLGGAISLITDDEAINWRNQITSKLESYGIIVQDPCKKIDDSVGELGDHKQYFKNLIKNKEFARVKKEFYKIIRYDLKCIDRSDFIIVYHDPKIPTVGTINEIVVASIEKKPILIVCDEKNLEFINPWLLTLIKPQWLFTSFDDMFTYLDEINSGKLDSSHWW